jgi:serine/threonine protein kinase
MIGQTFGHYRIEEKLGEGGMGVVYRARDLELNRNVAVKFLSEDAATPERRRRFQQEAQTASSLNHPHILTVHEAGTEAGQDYLVTEYVDGWTLREWVRHEQPSVRQIVDLVVTIADALASAHEAGIVHRDIKPQNILVSRRGFAKLADFGLAKLLERHSENETETVTVQTRPGMIVGTISYMAPEQVSGKPADSRADIFSFGVVLYEILTGQRPFSGKSDTEMAMSILHRPPVPLGELRPDVPYELRMIVEKALEKEPGDRYQSARELTVDLRRFQRMPISGTARIATPPQQPRRRWIAAIVLGCVLLSAAVLLWYLQRRDFFWISPLAGARFTRLTDFDGDELDASISPDGKLIAFLSDHDGQMDVWLNQSGGGEFVNLTKGKYPNVADPAARSIGFSGDSTQILIKGARGELAVPAIGGAARPFVEGRNISWSPDRTKIAYFTGAEGDPVFIADSNGGNPRQVFRDKRGMHCHNPTWSPDGGFIYFVRGYAMLDKTDIWRVPIAGGEPERITNHNSKVAFPTLLDARTLLYTATSEDGSGPWLYAMDVERRIPHRVSFGVEQYISVAATQDGRRIVAAVANPRASLWSVPISDSIAEESDTKRFVLPTVRALAPRFGPDYLVYLSSREGADGLWKYKDGIGTEIWKGSEGALSSPPAISPDGREICFSQREKLHVISSDGTNVRRLAESLRIRGTAAWSPDGKWIAVAAETQQGPRLYKIPVESR